MLHSPPEVKEHVPGSQIDASNTALREVQLTNLVKVGIIKPLGDEVLRQTSTKRVFRHRSFRRLLHSDDRNSKAVIIDNKTEMYKYAVINT